MYVYDIEEEGILSDDWVISSLSMEKNKITHLSMKTLI